MYHYYGNVLLYSYSYRSYSFTIALNYYNIKTLLMLFYDYWCLLIPVDMYWCLIFQCIPLIYIKPWCHYQTIRPLWYHDTQLVLLYSWLDNVVFIILTIRYIFFLLLYYNVYHQSQTPHSTKTLLIFFYYWHNFPLFCTYIKPFYHYTISKPYCWTVIIVIYHGKYTLYYCLFYYMYHSYPAPNSIDILLYNLNININCFTIT